MPDLLEPPPIDPDGTASLEEEHPAGTDDTGRWRLPRQIGDYHIIDRLGKGGRSHVFIARQRLVERLVALKVLRPGLAQKPRQLIAFKREAAAYGACDHPNILACHQAGQDGRWHFQALSLASRGDAIKALQGASRAKALKRVLQWIEQLAEAAGHLANRGLVHSDIKPANVLIHGDGRALLADLGSARAAGPDGVPSHIEGTLAYMSPEQGLNRPLDVRSDCYSIGASAWHLLAGKPPRPRCDDQGEALRQVCEDPLPPMSDEAGWVPKSVCAVIDRCVAVDPAHRYQRPRALADAARQVLDGLRRRHDDFGGPQGVDLTAGF